VLSGQ